LQVLHDIDILKATMVDFSTESREKIRVQDNLIDLMSIEIGKESKKKSDLILETAKLNEKVSRYIKKSGFDINMMNMTIKDLTMHHQKTLTNCLDQLSEINKRSELTNKQVNFMVSSLDPNDQFGFKKFVANVKLYAPLV